MKLYIQRLHFVTLILFPLQRPQNKRKIRSANSMDDGQFDQELEAAIALLRLDALDRIYSRHSRPR